MFMGELQCYLKSRKGDGNYHQTELIKYELYEEKELEEYLEKGYTG